MEAVWHPLKEKKMVLFQIIMWHKKSNEENESAGEIRKGVNCNAREKLRSVAYNGERYIVFHCPEASNHGIVMSIQAMGPVVAKTGCRLWIAGWGGSRVVFWGNIRPDLSREVALVILIIDVLGTYYSGSMPFSNIGHQRTEPGLHRFFVWFLAETLINCLFKSQMHLSSTNQKLLHSQIMAPFLVADLSHPSPHGLWMHLSKGSRFLVISSPGCT